MANESSERLVIGIDYGTTYTGVAFVCHNGKKQPTIGNISLITDWPGTARNATDEKVPSEVAYSDQKFEWGNKIRHYTEREAWTKLLLDETYSKDQLRLIQKLFHGDADLTEDEADPASDANLTRQLAKEPVDIVTDFLSGVRAHLQSVLEARFGTILNGLRREVVITVPAGWSEKAKNLTYKAVCNAGFDVDETKISMITEPEAAAIYILRDLNDGPFQNIKPGDHFVVCDAGGGTVDIITYRVDSLSPLFTIKEAVVGIGAKCGAIFVDRQFKVWLRQKLGVEKFRKIRRELLNAGSRMMKDFEIAKISFEDDEETMSFVWMPPDIGANNDPTIDVVDGEMRIDSDRMREIFDPCVNQILKLIDDQTAEVTSKSATVKYVLLAGGFGKSKYLFKRMKERYAERGIEVIKPSNPWTAVVRGAVIEKVDPMGSSLLQLRLCRRNLGLSLVELFDEAKHKDMKEGDKIVDSSTEITFVKGIYKLNHVLIL
jgi:molecular chaperone DnaK (HSP70)